MMRNKVTLWCLATFLVVGCASTGDVHKSELVGYNRPRGYGEIPFGMVPVPSGYFKMGLKSPDISSSDNAPVVTTTISAFWMDETEITNAEYLQFVKWTEEAAIRKKLMEDGVEGFAIEQDQFGEDLTEPIINWNQTYSMKDELVRESIRAMQQESVSYGGYVRSWEMNKANLRYTYEVTDNVQAALEKNKYDYLSDRFRPGATVIDKEGESKQVTSAKDFVFDYTLSVYPDTLCWVRDFSYSYNDPVMESYFSDPAYQDYPVVGVTWEQAVAFTHWRTLIKILFGDQSAVGRYRLPSESEWEYAASGGKEGVNFPWGGPYLRDKEACFRANFKPLRGNYAADGYARTSPVKSFLPNDYGLYDMAGNVSEWTRTAYDESAYYYVHDFNPNFEYNAKATDPPALKRKVVKGGSWKDVRYFLQMGVRSYEYQDISHSFLGFRCVKDSESVE